MQAISPITGWCLDHIVALDFHSPGVAGAFFRASAERRQVIAAFLASQPAPSHAKEAIEIAEFIGRARHKEILVAAFGTAPCGMRGALARSGAEPHSRSFYRILFQLLSSPQQVEIASAIKRLDSVDLLRLRIAQTLPADICTANLVKLIESVRMAADVATLVDLLTRNGIDRRRLAQALGHASSDTQLSQLWDRWTQKLAFPPHPLPPSDHFIPVANGAELNRLALRYRNCVRRYLAQVLEGSDAFAEFVFAGKRTVVHIRKVDGRWLLEGLFSKDNERPAPEVRSAAISYLAERGIGMAERPREIDGEWAVLRRLSPVHMFGF